LIFQDFTSS